MYLVVYDCGNKLRYRLIKNHIITKIGDITSIGWRVIDIQVFVHDRFYTVENSLKILQRMSNKHLKKVRRRQKLIDLINLLHDTFS